MSLKFARIKNKAYLCNRKPQKQGEMAEWSIAAVLKTVEGHTSGGSNPSLSAIKPDYQAFVVSTHEFTHDFWDQLQNRRMVINLCLSI